MHLALSAIFRHFKMTQKVLIIGSGSREHALAWKISQSNEVEKVYISPGNAGTHSVNKSVNVELSLNDYECVADWCVITQINLVVIGPEAYLAGGLTDVLQSRGIQCFGPSKNAAQIEASKFFSKQFMNQFNIPTARWNSFTDTDEAINFVETCDFDGVVVKASGLAAGKGVVVAKNKDEATEAILEIMEMKKFGSAGETIIIEEKLQGEEISVFAFSDGTSSFCFPPAQDYKRAHDGDQGPNTGGMGAYCPVNHVSTELLSSISTEIVQRTVDGMRQNGVPFVGLLYTGLMLTKDGPKVLEYNCRFGDPETQVVLPLLSSDLYAIMKSCCDGTLLKHQPVFATDESAITVVLASGGYPGTYKKGLAIHGLNTVKDLPNVTLFHAGTKKTCDEIKTNGGRIVSVTSMDKSLSEARKRCYHAISFLSFDEMFYRKDIAQKAIGSPLTNGMSYAEAGVNIDAGNSLVEAIKPLAASTNRIGCVSGLGGFGAIFDLKAAGYTDPIIVSGTDGVGTKLQIAREVGCHSTIGIDLVAMCVNDILAQGAEPLFFLDYYACGRLETDIAKEVIAGITDGCALAGCALLGGETAEMPGMYEGSKYDLAGFAVGAVERCQVLPDLSSISPGDTVIGIASSGVHSNGFSLVRKIVETSGLTYADVCPFDKSKTLGQALLTSTKIYVKSVLPLMKDGCIKAFAHITGGGLLENVPRVLPSQVNCIIDAHAWQIPPVFAWLCDIGNLDHTELMRTFNCGIGAILVVDGKNAEMMLSRLHSAGEKAWPIGILSPVVDDSKPRVDVKGFELSMNLAMKEYSTLQLLAKRTKREHKKVGVLISGSGTNLQALIDHSLKSTSSAKIVLVISNVENAYGLQRAKLAGIPTLVISHKGKKRLDFDMELLSAFKNAGVEMLCLAGFMRILTGEFVREWYGKLINIHPSLLPSFKGIDAHAQALKAGVKLTGCTAHFVVEEVDAGGIIAQDVVPILPNDTVETLQERVKLKEWEVFPKAMELVASNKVKLVDSNVVTCSDERS